MKHYAIDLRIGGHGLPEALKKELENAECKSTPLSSKIEAYLCRSETVILVNSIDDSILVDILNPPPELLDRLLKALPPAQSIVRVLERGFSLEEPV